MALQQKTVRIRGQRRTEVQKTKKPPAPAFDLSVTIAWSAVIWREEPKTNHNYAARDRCGRGGERREGRPRRRRHQAHHPQFAPILLLATLSNGERALPRGGQAKQYAYGVAKSEVRVRTGREMFFWAEGFVTMPLLPFCLRRTITSLTD